MRVLGTEYRYTLPLKVKIKKEKTDKIVPVEYVKPRNIVPSRCIPEGKHGENRIWSAAISLVPLHLPPPLKNTPRNRKSTGRINM